MEPKAPHNDGNRLGCIHGRTDCRGPSSYHDDIDFETHQLGRKLKHPIFVSPPPPYRYSITMFFPSMYPSLRSASRIASARVDSVAGSDDDRYPIRGTFFVCCASAEKQSAKCMAHSARKVTFLFIFFFASRHSSLDTRPSLHTSFRALFITPNEGICQTRSSGAARD